MSILRLYHAVGDHVHVLIIHLCSHIAVDIVYDLVFCCKVLRRYDTMFNIQLAHQELFIDLNMFWYQNQK